jgi:hypothetical protein
VPFLFRSYWKTLFVLGVERVVPLPGRATQPHLRAGEVDARHDVSPALAAEEKFAVF